MEPGCTKFFVKRASPPPLSPALEPGSTPMASVTLSCRELDLMGILWPRDSSTVTGIHNELEDDLEEEPGEDAQDGECPGKDS